jgi:2-keto-4-pentenoate hydratase/2-oxohepta-3-ene-1,7-dioic acid hydratase in catechol pathway
MVGGESQIEQHVPLTRSSIMTFVIPEPPRATIPIEGSPAIFPVRRIFCVGRNYAEHAREMGGDPVVS